MNTYKVDLPLERLQRDKDVRTRLMRDVRKAVKGAKADNRPRYLWKRRTDQSMGYWFQVDADLHKDPEVMEMLKPYGFTPASPPVLPQSEWKAL